LNSSLEESYRLYILYFFVVLKLPTASHPLANYEFYVELRNITNGKSVFGWITADEGDEEAMQNYVGR
jgi:hypothetical protein